MVSRSLSTSHPSKRTGGNVTLIIDAVKKKNGNTSPIKHCKSLLIYDPGVLVFGPRFVCPQGSELAAQPEVKV